MSAPLSPWTVRLLELLEDGQWHETEKVITTLAKLVPPGVAKRKAEWVRARQGKRRHTTASERSLQRPDEFLIRVGARRIVRDAILRSARVERRIINGIRYLRLKP